MGALSRQLPRLDMLCLIFRFSNRSRNTVHLDHSKRLMPIAGYGSSRSPETVHADHQIRSKPISFGGGILKYQFAIGQLRPKSKFTSNLEERWSSPDCGVNSPPSC